MERDFAPAHHAVLSLGPIQVKKKMRAVTDFYHTPKKRTSGELFSVLCRRAVRSANFLVMRIAALSDQAGGVNIFLRSVGERGMVRANASTIHGTG